MDSTENLELVDHHKDLGEKGLPPIDSGRRAWLFLAACFIIEGLIWGIYSYTLPLNGEILMV